MFREELSMNIVKKLCIIGLSVCIFGCWATIVTTTVKYAVPIYKVGETFAEYTGCLTSSSEIEDSRIESKQND
jgi:hypothetical protein